MIGRRQSTADKPRLVSYIDAMIRTGGMISKLWSAVAFVLLLVVTAHAVAPVAPELSRRSGSAFNASTQDVSLKNGSRAEVSRQVVRLEPDGPPAAMALIAVRTVGDRAGGDRHPHTFAPDLISSGIDTAPVGARAPPLV
jgi:hypothetical protein